jgi:hypothetical protein
MSMSALPNLPLSAPTTLPPSLNESASAGPSPEAGAYPTPPVAQARFDWQPGTDGVLDAIQRVYS